MGELGLVDSHCSMAFFSYEFPSRSITGDRMTDSVSGQ